MKQKLWWWVRSLAIALILVPLLAHGVALTGFLLMSLLHEASGYTPGGRIAMWGITCTLGGVAMFALGYGWAKFATPQENGAARQNVLLVPALLVLLVWVTMLHLADLSFVDMTENPLLLITLPWMGITLFSLLSGWLWGMVLIPVGTQLCFTLGCYWRNRHQADNRRAKKIRQLLILLLLSLGIIALYQATLRADKFSLGEGPRLDEQVDRWDYRPDQEDNRLTPLRGAAQIRFGRNWPRLDGATALYPLYASAFYGLREPGVKADGYLNCNRTSGAYRNIIEGSVDMIFVAQPSAGQKQRAAEAKVQLDFRPFAREAFVFIVNADNPVESLTEQQVRDIFSGKITRWSEVGGNNSKIEVWQRPEDSGSQTAMLANVMQGTPMLPPKETEVATMMGGLIRRVADYQNTRGAIGYTFRYYATRMNKNSGIKLLAIGGVAPTVENIQNGTYPWVADVFMVTRREAGEETRRLAEWFLSPQGQRLVQDAGYVPLHTAAADQTTF
ncbi:PstS family phosphate ABC transporter substrate-binding protein [Intestinirhabdus alba]|uniref:Phosphate ABC transporter substrate-binding protein n=1 Tax=Intestinirhabdus alba TaxID=2899544 RepID=A0A6L6IU14_9ENTR|nr:PstS family phosphate ABC transporter substrate-binding protein [Intestinirhabdus alba]MTH48520.1 phosphate ABC transporter substrate-binding protein [Intestinirhabdus alba]